MGKRFKRTGTDYRLHFDDPDLEDFECVMRGLSFAGIETLMGLMGELQGFQGATDELRPEQIATLRKFFEWIAGGLRSWNLDDDDDQPVPATYEGVASQDLPFLMLIAQGWMQAITAAPPPLPGGSKPGGTAPEESLSLASLSSSLPSSPAPS